MTQTRKFILPALAAGLLAAAPAWAEGTFATKSLTPETAVKLAQATLDACRTRGYQVAVAVVDRHGNLQALIRDRFAGPHTPETAKRKAWTAVTFKTDTSTLVAITQPGQEQSGMRHIPGAMVIGGGVMVEESGQLVGGLGVSGAPGGPADEECAKDGLAAIEGDLAF